MISLSKYSRFINKQQMKYPILPIVIYFTLFFLIDLSGIMNLYGQNFVRRFINMFRRLDYLNYEKKLKPFGEKLDAVLDKNDLAKMQSIKIPEKKDMGFLTRKKTTTHQCCKNYSAEETKIVKEMREKIRKKYEEKIGKPLYLIDHSDPTIYRYHGDKSQHLWHVDPRNLPEIYNIIVCIKKVGNISPLQYKDINGEIHSIHFNEGDAAIFNGGTTIHQVPPNDDPHSERTVLSIAFTSDPEIGRDVSMGENMCTYIEGGNNYFNLFKMAFAVFVLNYVLSFSSGLNRLSYKYIVPFFVILLLLAKYVPYYTNIPLGTGRPASISYNLVVLAAFMIFTLSFKGGFLFFSYFLFSDVFFPSSWVAYD